MGNVEAWTISFLTLLSIGEAFVIFDLAGRIWLHNAF